MQHPQQNTTATDKQTGAMFGLDGFRDPRAAQALRLRIAEAATPLTHPVTIMEVCGSHTMAIARYGIKQLLPANINLVSGPGCPVCVTPTGYIDTAIELARCGHHIFSFGDMIHVPGSHESLADAQASGDAVTVCYSPEAALTYAQEHKKTEVVFLAIGFETTLAPTVALLARPDLPENFSLLTAFKCVPPALHALRVDPDLNIDAFLCPAHVSAIIGADAYRPFAGTDGLPCVIAGFEPLDILLGILGIVEQLADNRAEVDNQYSRVVTASGNKRAQQIIDIYLQPCDAVWRGIGIIPGSALELRPAYAGHDACKRFNLTIESGEEPAGCACGAMIKGQLQPTDCPLFGKGCTPTTPVGPCMVSSEGSCAAAFRYSGVVS